LANTAGAKICRNYPFTPDAIGLPYLSAGTGTACTLAIAGRFEHHPYSGGCGTFSTVIAAGCLSNLWQWCPGASIGAVLLASAFGNFSYLGLPVLSQTFGDWAQVIAIQFDLLASTPILFSVGIILARYYGSSATGIHPLLSLFQVPAIWAAIAGLLLSIFAIPMPLWVNETLATLGAAVVPLMLLSVGMALSWQSGWAARIPVLLPVISIQLLFMPLIAWGASIGVGMPEQYLAPTIIEAAMPTMVLGLVICDRFKLNVALYAEAVTLTTVCSMLTLPLWLQLAS
jgi:hypothetical protein